MNPCLSNPCLRRVALAAALTTAAIAAVTGTSLPAAAGAPVQCGNTDANAQLAASQSTFPADQPTVVTVSGNGYLVPPHIEGNDVFGGVYVFFGWVGDPASFGPSTRAQGNGQGLPGVSYAHPGESGGAETRDDGTGTIRLVSFSGGGVSGEATPFHMTCHGGSWITEMTVPGATFAMFDPVTSQTLTYDCTALASGQCGFFSIGAHGVPNATNERFFPVTFTGPAPAAPGPDQQAVPPAPAPATAVDTAAPTTLPATTVATPSPTTATEADVATAVTTRPPDADGAIQATVVEVTDVDSSIAPLVIGVLVAGGLIAAWVIVSRRNRPTSPGLPLPG